MATCGLCGKHFRSDEGEINTDGDFVCFGCGEASGAGAGAQCPECGEYSVEYKDDGECPHCGQMREEGAGDEEEGGEEEPKEEEDEEEEKGPRRR
jgi:hypothetical protein